VASKFGNGKRGYGRGYTLQYSFFKNNIICIQEPAPSSIVYTENFVMATTFNTTFTPAHAHPRFRPSAFTRD